MNVMKPRKQTKLTMRQIISLTITLIVITVIIFDANQVNGRVKTTIDEMDEVQTPLSQIEMFKTDKLMGDLYAYAPKVVINEIDKMVQSINESILSREEQKIYEPTEEELALWKQLTEKLDEETSFQLSLPLDEAEISDEENRDEVDLGAAVLDMIQPLITPDDYDTLLKLRQQFFDTEESALNQTNAYYEMKNIVEKYTQFDATALLLNLVEEQTFCNKAFYEVQNDLNVKYMPPTSVGLPQVTESESVKYMEYWNKVQKMIPSSILRNFSYYKVASDGEAETLAYVISVDDQGDKWCLNLDPQDILEDGSFPFTIIHEMAHYMSLNDEQMRYFTDEIESFSLSRYADDSCVANEMSYLNLYYQRFWMPLQIDWKSNPDNELFYYRHMNQFITSYAATNCTEDFAETFAAYVLMENAPNVAIQEKFDFFDSIPSINWLKRNIHYNLIKHDIKVDTSLIY